MKPVFPICFLTLVFAGCAATADTNQPPKRITQSPGNGLREVGIVLRALPPVGAVLRVQIAITNLAVKGMSLDNARLPTHI
jgi:hypothetical protein